MMMTEISAQDRCHPWGLDNDAWVMLWPQGHHVPTADFWREVREQMADQELSLDEALAFVCQVHGRIDREEL